MNVTKQLPQVILPLACLPDIEYFCWLFHASGVLVEIQETYPKQTCRNRYSIETANGVLNLVVPVTKPDGNHTCTRDILLDHKSPWARIHWRTIESAYNKSPYFLYYREAFESIFLAPPKLLVDFNLKILEACCGILKTDPGIVLTENYRKGYENAVDMRQLIMHKRKTVHTWSVQEFEPYMQVFSDRHPFFPNLSIIDLIFNEGPSAAHYLYRHCPGNKPVKQPDIQSSHDGCSSVSS